MSPSREHMSRALELLIAGGLTAVGIAVGSPNVLAGVLTTAAGIGSNWAADLAKEGFEAWRDRWVRDGVRNRDIARGLARAFRRAVDDLEAAWREHPRYRHLVVPLW